MNFKYFWKHFTKERHPRRLFGNLLFWFCSLLYMEILFQIKLFGTFDTNFLFVLCFTALISLVLSGLLGLLPSKANRITSCVLIGLFSLLFCGQLICQCLFGTLCGIPPAGLSSPNYGNLVKIGELLPILAMLLPIPCSIVLVHKQRRIFHLSRNIYRVLLPVLALVIQFLIAQCLSIGGTDVNSAHYVYHHTASTEQTVQRFGLLTAMRLDLFSDREVPPPPTADSSEPTAPTIPSTEDYTEPEETKIPLKIQIFGDSMSDNTWGDKRTWVNLLQNYLPEYDLTIVNNAIGGNSLMKLTTDNGVLKGIAHQLSSEQTPICKDADLIIVWAGSNDWSSNPDLGTLQNGDMSTFYGSVQYVIETLQHTGSHLLFITPMQRNSVSDQQNRTDMDLYGNRLNSKSATLEQYAQAILQTCAYYDVPCLDLYHTSGITQDNIFFYAADGLHLDAEAEPMIAERIAQAILNPEICTPRDIIPAYDLSVLTDVYHNRLCEPIPVNGTRIFLNWNFDGIKTAFSNGYVTLRYPVKINGTELVVCSTETASYNEENGYWTFVSYFEHEGVLIRVNIVFKEYGLEATAVSLG